MNERKKERVECRGEKEGYSREEGWRFEGAGGGLRSVVAVAVTWLWGRGTRKLGVRSELKLECWVWVLLCFCRSKGRGGGGFWEFAWKQSAR